MCIREDWGWLSHRHRLYRPPSRHIVASSRFLLSISPSGSFCDRPGYTHRKCPVTGYNDSARLRRMLKNVMVAALRADHPSRSSRVTTLRRLVSRASLGKRMRPRFAQIFAHFWPKVNEVGTLSCSSRGVPTTIPRSPLTRPNDPPELGYGACGTPQGDPTQRHLDLRRRAAAGPIAALSSTGNSRSEEIDADGSHLHRCNRWRKRDEYTGAGLAEPG